MRQAVTRRNKKKSSYGVFILFLFFSLFLVAGLGTLIFGSPALSRPGIEEEVLALASSLKDYSDYTLLVEESGPGYLLRFSGQVHKGNLFGTVDTYNLQIFSDGEKYFVRGGELFEKWETAETAELDGLAAFTRDPFELLNAILEESAFIAQRGPDGVVEGKDCCTYLLELIEHSAFLKSLFPESVDILVDNLRLYLWFGKEDSFLYKMALIYEVTNAEEKALISRVYSLNLQTQEMPGDLPVKERSQEI